MYFRSLYENHVQNSGGLEHPYNGVITGTGTNEY